jgi:hypothetical protein
MGLFLLFLLLTFSAHSQPDEPGTKGENASVPVSETNAMTNNIRLDVNHNDKGRMEAFLEMLNEKFEPVPFNWRSWKQSDSVVDAVKLTNITRSLTITIFFLETYSAGDVLAKANALPFEDTARWSMNGAVMYLVESPDRDKVDHVLGLFAGRE